MVIFRLNGLEINLRLQTSILVLCVSLFFCIQIFLASDVQGSSPIIGRHIIYDSSFDDWAVASHSLQPIFRDHKTIDSLMTPAFLTKNYSDINQISFSSDGRYLNATIWLTNPPGLLN